jgi:hypothetical protein
MAHAARLVIRERLPDFLLSIHHERSVTREGFFERLATENEKFRLCRGLNPNVGAVALKYGELGFRCNVICIQPELSLEDRQCGGVALLKSQFQLRACFQMNVPQTDGREGLRRTCFSLEGSRNDSQRSAVSGQLHRRNFAFKNSLILRRRHLEMRGQIDPKLRGFEGSSMTREFLSV